MKNNKNSMNNTIAIFAYLPPLALQIAFFIYQFKHKILSIWNIVSTLMVVGIFINAIRMMISEKREKSKLIKMSDPDIVTGGSTIDYSKPQKRSKKNIAIFLLISIALFGLSALFFNIHTKKSNGLQVVNSTVVDQWGKKTVTTEETDEGITQTEEEYIEVAVEYEFNGVKKSTIITAKNTDKIYVDELKIYVDETGKFVNDYGRIFAWKIEGIIFLISAIIMLLITIFALGIEFIAGTIFSLIGTALFFFVGSPFIENILYNDISCFVACFANIGFYMLIYGFVNLIYTKLKPSRAETTALQNTTIPATYIEPEYQEQNYQEQPYGEDTLDSQTEEPNKPISLKCKGCGSNMSPTDNFCQYCGTKKD